MNTDTDAAINWLRLLHSYAPGLRNTGTVAEKLAKVEKRTGIKRIQFEHPARNALLDAISPRIGNPIKNVIIVGTAGDGKTSLMMECQQVLQVSNSKTEAGGIERFDAETADGPRHFIFIYDLSAWRGNEAISEDQLNVIYQLADSVAGNQTTTFVIAANDGALHEILHDDLPEDAPANTKQLRVTIDHLHEESKQIQIDADAPADLRLLNLSMIPSEVFMRECLKAVLERPEWNNSAFGSGTGILSPNSPVIRNYKLLTSETVRDKLLTLSKLADACGFHLSIRDLLGLITNALLGHPKATKGVLTLNAGGNAIIEANPDQAPLHKLLFGDSLPESSSSNRPCFTFLSLLQIGRETTNELDDLLIFGGIDDEDQELRTRFDTVVKNDPLEQREQALSSLATLYVIGDIDNESTLELREVLAFERKRLFLHADSTTFDSLGLWSTTAFHHAGIYLTEILDKLRLGQPPSPHLIRKIIGGLNRIWTGFLLKEYSDTLYLCTGLDITTAPVSDIFLGKIELDGVLNDNIRLDLDHKSLPRIVFDMPAQKEAFAFRLTLQRFEFLMRVANGAMPTSFSRESTEDFAVLKQRCIRDLFPKAPTTLRRVVPDASGQMGFESIHSH
jgi:hypothetical protein